MPRIAALDCGTHSLRLLVADVDLTTNILTDVERAMTIVRLGQGVDRTRRLSDEALARTFATTEDYAARCRRHGVEAIRFVATSATRDATNSQEFVEGVSQRIGVEPEVISGEEEAALSFRGATAALSASHAGPFLIVDLGGGSTELVLGTSVPEAIYSMQVGCVRMTERHQFSDPPTSDQITAAIDDIRAELDQAALVVPLGRTTTLVGLAGSVTTVTAHALHLDSYRPELIDGAVISMDVAVEAANDILARPYESRARLGFMHPGRVDVIGGGALVWREIMLRVREEVRRVGRDLESIVASEHDMLDGIALTLAERLADSHS
jgi:exopolyphosphatase/guanosine-5'-triphosphate,3'-diphosphate pyrophosphatase